MVNCSECKYWFQGDVVGGLCLKCQGVNNRGVHYWNRCDFFEQKGTSMASCSECKYWDKPTPRDDPTCGVCSNKYNKLEGIGGRLVGKTFYCVFFEQKGALMAFCGDCREWKPTEHSKDWGWCPDSQLEKHKSEEACGCIYLKREESMMGMCKECKWWRQFDEHSGAGECRCLNVGTKEPYLGIISTYEFEGKDYISPKVPSSFGCVHFEQKSKEPFRVLAGDTGIAFGNEWIYLDETSRDDLKHLCSWLNEHWRE